VRCVGLARKGLRMRADHARWQLSPAPSVSPSAPPKTTISTTMISMMSQILI
jgi:hypothetical protein